MGKCVQDPEVLSAAAPSGGCSSGSRRFLSERDRLSDSLTGRKLKGKRRNLIKKRKKDVVFKNSFMKRSSRGWGGERRQGLFPENKNSQRTTRSFTTEELFGRGLNCRAKQQHQLQTRACVHESMHACGVRHDQNRVILSNNVFSSMAAPLVARPPLQTTVLMPGTDPLRSAPITEAAAAVPAQGRRFAPTFAAKVTWFFTFYDCD